MQIVESDIVIANKDGSIVHFDYRNGVMKPSIVQILPEDHGMQLKNLAIF